jgi:N-acetylmuramoyl-L-alanine amidase
MPTWKGIIGRGFTPQGFKDYVGSLSFRDWRPQFVVVHNTSAPRLSQWHSHPGEERMRNLESFFRDTQGWSAGPHLFIADDLIWVFTPLITSGVHSPSWNGISWGVEMVGEYEEEEFSPAVRENTVDALATLHAWRGLDPKTIRFHKEDPKTTHTTCPGRNVNQADLIGRVAERIAGDLGEHPTTRPEPGVTAPIIPPSAPTIIGPPATEGRFTNITATEFGGGSEAGMDSAYGGTVDPSALQVSLPARLPAGKRRVRVHHLASSRSVVCTVNDVGPWNTLDEYWTTNVRPRAEAQHRNRTPAGNGEVPTNDAGIDLTPAVFEAFGVSGPVNTRTTHVDWEFV